MLDGISPQQCNRQPTTLIRLGHFAQGTGKPTLADDSILRLFSQNSPTKPRTESRYGATVFSTLATLYSSPPCRAHPSGRLSQRQAANTSSQSLNTGGVGIGYLLADSTRDGKFTPSVMCTTVPTHGVRCSSVLSSIRLWLDLDSDNKEKAGKPKRRRL